jgi:tetrapyrrole methylase family protein / MazG family protein
MVHLPDYEASGAQSFTLKDRYSMDELLAIMRFLRGEHGCPWDRVQTHQSLRQNLLEEAYEAIDAIEQGQPETMCDELGDVLMQVVFHAQIASETGAFDFSDVVSAIGRKLISRHTHIFGTDEANTANDVMDRWAENKRIEKGHDSYTEVLRDVPRALPALQRSYKIQQKAAQTGFDWPESAGPRQKIEEELDEMDQIVARADQNQPDEEKLEEEIGDVLFSVVNYARHLGIHPEMALNRANEKFISRFSAIEDLARARDLELDDMTLDQMDELWEWVKKNKQKEKQEI